MLKNRAAKLVPNATVRIGCASKREKRRIQLPSYDMMEIATDNLQYFLPLSNPPLFTHLSRLANFNFLFLLSLRPLTIFSFCQWAVNTSDSWQSQSEAHTLSWQSWVNGCGADVDLKKIKCTLRSRRRADDYVLPVPTIGESDRV